MPYPQRGFQNRRGVWIDFCVSLREAADGETPSVTGYPWVPVNPHYAGILHDLRNNAPQIQLCLFHAGDNVENDAKLLRGKYPGFDKLYDAASRTCTYRIVENSNFAISGKNPVIVAYWASSSHPFAMKAFQTVDAALDFVLDREDWKKEIANKHTQQQLQPSKEDVRDHSRSGDASKGFDLTSAPRDQPAIENPQVVILLAIEEVLNVPNVGIVVRNKSLRSTLTRAETQGILLDVRQRPKDDAAALKFVSGAEKPRSRLRPDSVLKFSRRHIKTSTALPISNASEIKIKVALERVFVITRHPSPVSANRPFVLAYWKPNGLRAGKFFETPAQAVESAMDVALHNATRVHRRPMLPQNTPELNEPGPTIGSTLRHKSQYGDLRPKTHGDNSAPGPLKLLAVHTTVSDTAHSSIPKILVTDDAEQPNTQPDSSEIEPLALQVTVEQPLKRRSLLSSLDDLVDGLAKQKQEVLYDLNEVIEGLRKIQAGPNPKTPEEAIALEQGIADILEDVDQLEQMFATIAPSPETDISDLPELDSSSSKTATPLSSPGQKCRADDEQFLEKTTADLEGELASYLKSRSIQDDHRNSTSSLEAELDARYKLRTRAKGTRSPEGSES